MDQDGSRAIRFNRSTLVLLVTLCVTSALIDGTATARQARTTRVSVRIDLPSSQIVEADDNSWVAAISANGMWVAFESFASNLVTGGIRRDGGPDTNGERDIYLHFRAHHDFRTRRVSVSSAWWQF